MKNLVQKSARFMFRSLLLIASICLFLLVALQIALLVGINALNAGKAHGFIQAQVTSALAESGYDATFDGLFYDPARGFTFYNLKVLDKAGAIATADRLSIDVTFSKIPFRRLDMIVSAGELNLIRLPDAQAENGNSRLQPFSLPDLYFRTFNIFPLRIDKLNIGKDIAGYPLSISPTLKATVRLGDDVTVDASLSSEASAKAGNILLPEEIEVKGSFTPSILAFALDTLSIQSPDYRISGKGEGTLTPDGKINAGFSAEYPDLKMLTQGNLDSARLSLTIGGVYGRPVIRMDGILTPASLKENGLTDIIVSAATDDLKGNIDVKTSYLGEPVSIDMALAYEEGRLKFESLKGISPMAALSGTGTMSMQSHIFDGKISITASDLSYYKNLLSKDIAGALKADMVFGQAGEAQALDVNASVEQIRLEGMRLEKADAEAHFADIKYPWPQTASIRISNLSVSDTISLDKAQAVIKGTGSEAYNLSLSGQGNAPFALSFNGSADLSDIAGDFPTVGNINLTTAIGDSAITLTGEVDRNTVDLKASAKNFRGSDIPVALPDTLANIRLNGEITMSGSPATPSTQAHLVAAGAGTGKYKTLEITADANHQVDKASLVISGKGAGIRELRANSASPLTFSLFPFAFNMDTNAPLSGTIQADLDLGAISPFFLPPTQEFSAGLNANADLGGTLASPDVRGTLRLWNGRFTDRQNGVVVRELNIDSSFTEAALAVRSITATDGEKGRMDGRGNLDFTGKGNTDLSFSMEKFHLPSSNLADGMMNASLSLVNAGTGYALGGSVDVDHMNVIIPETFQSKIPELNIVERKKGDVSDTPSRTVSLAVSVNAPNRIFVRGWGLDAEFGGQLDISGDAAAPLFNGNLASKRGRYEEFGKRFTLARADLRFQGEIPPSPYLDVEATTPANDVTASILLAGPVAKPSITFSSVPALPQDEVLSRLLFGRDTTKITPFQAVQLAQALRRFSGEGGGGGLNPLEMLRSATGLDDISIDTGAKGETNVGVGKYLTDKVYLEFEKGKAPGSGAANVQIELTPNINIQSEIGQDARAGGGIFWKKDY
jgi:translocation and assembly module TamB